MNHTEVRIFGMHQRVRDEISNVLDCTDIGIDDVFTVSSTDMMSVEQFKSRIFYRVPCTACEAYIKKYIPRNGSQSYGLAYLTSLSADGARRSNFYRLIKLITLSHVLDVCDIPLQNAIDRVYVTRMNLYNLSTSSERPVRLVMSGDTRNSDNTFSYGSTGYVMDYNGYNAYYR